MFDRFKTKFQIKTLPYGSRGFVSIKAGSFAICKDLIIDDLRGIKGWRILLDLNKNYSKDIDGEYVLPIRKINGKVVDLYEIYFHPKFFKKIKTEQGENNSHPLIEDLYKLIVKISNNPNYILNYDEIIKEKNDGGKSNWSFLSVDPFHQQFNFPNERELLFYNPNESDLLELVDFSNTLFDLKPSKDTLYYGKSSDEIKADFNSILDSSNINPNLKNQFIADFNLNELADNINISPEKANKLLREKFSSGMILYGPPGTGKTYIVEKYIMLIFKKFGFLADPVKLPDILGAKDSMYVGASSRAVRRIFQPIIENVIKTQKPCFFFVDEADKVIEVGNESVDMMKNYINRETYPGLIMCFNTNLENGIDNGLKERRLHGVEYNFPNFKISKNIWILNISTLFENEDINNFTQDDFNLLAKLTAENVGLDSIDTFCRQYRTKTGTNRTQKIDIKSFILSYVENTLIRIEDNKKIKLNSYGKNNQYFNEKELENLRKKYDNQKFKLISALKGESEDDLSKKNNEIIIGLGREDSENLYYKNYLNLINSYNSLNLNQLDLNILKDIFQNLTFLIDNLRQGEIHFRQEILNSENFIENFKKYLTDAKEFVSNYLISHENKQILLQIPELIGVEIETHNLDELKKFFLINLKIFFGKLPPNNLFDLKFNTTTQDSKNLKPFVTSNNSNVIDAEIIGEKIDIKKKKSEIKGFDKNIYDNLNNSFEFIKNTIGNLERINLRVNSNFKTNLNDFNPNYFVLEYKKTQEYTNDLKILNLYLQSLIYINRYFEDYIKYNNLNLDRTWFGIKKNKQAKSIKKDIAGSISLLKIWLDKNYLNSIHFTSLQKLLMDLINNKNN